EGRNLLEFKRAEQVAVHLLPVANAQLQSPQGASHLLTNDSYALSVSNLDLDVGDLRAQVQEFLSAQQLHVHVARVVLVHAAVEHRRDAEALGSQHHAHRAQVAEQRDQADDVAN